MITTMRTESTKALLLLAILGVMALGSTRAEADFYRVVDAETGEPIEGAVIVIVWNGSYATGIMDGGGNGPLKAIERVTGRDGKAFVMSGFALGSQSRNSVIYKPGYRARIERTRDVSAPLFAEPVLGLTKTSARDAAYRGPGELGVPLCGRPKQMGCVRPEWVPQLMRLFQEQ